MPLVRALLAAALPKGLIVSDSATSLSLSVPSTNGVTRHVFLFLAVLLNIMLVRFIHVVWVAILHVPSILVGIPVAPSFELP